MANIIDYKGNRSLQLTSSECIYRGVDIPSGSGDVRFGMCINFPESANQVFDPIVSKYETMRLLFTGIPSPDPVTYFGIGSINGEFNSVSKVFNNAVGGTVPTIRRTSSNCLQRSSNITNTIIQTYNNGLDLLGVNDGATSSSGIFMMIRLYKDNSSGYFNFEFRASHAGLNGSVNTVTLTDQQFRDYMTNLSLSGVVASGGFAPDGLDLISEIKGIFFSWPFFNVPLTIPIMGYRAITT